MARANSIEFPPPPEAPPERERFRLWTPLQLKEMPAPNWLIDNWLPENALAVAYGAPAGGKTLLAMDWCLSVATGQPNWMGQDIPRARRTIYVAAEGCGGLGRRIQAWEQVYGEATHHCLFVLEPVNLLQPVEVRQFVKKVLGQPEPPALIALDTLHRMIPGGDENSSQDVGAAIASCDLIRNETGATVLLIHHVGKSGQTERGSSALRGAADVMIRVESDGQSVTIAQDKSKDSALADAVHLNIQTVDIGEMGSSVILGTISGAMIVLSQSTRSVFTVLSECSLSDGMSCSDWKKAANVSDATFFRARSDLVRRGYVIEDTIGRSKRYRPQQGATITLSSNYQ